MCVSESGALTCVKVKTIESREELTWNRNKAARPESIFESDFVVYDGDVDGMVGVKVSVFWATVTYIYLQIKPLATSCRQTNGNPRWAWRDIRLSKIKSEPNRERQEVL